MTGTGLVTAFEVAYAVTAVGVLLLLVEKRLFAPRLRQRTLAPLGSVLIVTFAVFVVSLFLVPSHPASSEAFRVATGVALLAIPLTALAGQVRGDLAAAMSLGQIALRANEELLDPAAAQRVIGDAVGDPTLRLALWDADIGGYVDVDRSPLALPQDTRARAVTPITQGGQPVAALVHDPSLNADTEVVEALAATSLMLIDKARLLEELRESRSRIVRASERERRALERDLHDGAQAQLVALHIRLELARELTEPAKIRDQLDESQRVLELALEELRLLAHGIYPPALRDLGPAGALQSLASNSSVPVEVIDEGIGRSSDATEAAIYFCAREAIQNSAKHAGPRARALIELRRRENAIELTVTDDGVGIAPHTNGDGLGIIGMRDRIGAVGGQLEIVSAPGQGTSVHATIPDAA